MNSAKQETKSYAEIRMEEIRFDPDKDFALIDYMPGSAGSKKKHPLFWSDQSGNLCIGVLGLDGEFHTYDESASNSRHKIRPYHWKRMARVTDGNKYYPCKKGLGVFPYIPREIIKKYQAGEKIQRLVITEGYIKAYVGARHFDVIGIPGINIWGSKGTGKIFPLIESVIKKCEVEELIFLSDADTLTVRWREGKDLYERPHNFYIAVLKFQKVAKEFDLPLYYVHFKKDLKYKGLDDLILNQKPRATKKMVKEILKGGGNDFTKRLYATDLKPKDLRGYFGIENVQTFYRIYEKEIGLQEFIWKRGLYKFNTETYPAAVECIKNGYAAPFVMIASIIYRWGGKPTRRGTVENQLMRVTKDQIEKEVAHLPDYKKIAPAIWKDIDYSHGAINMPSHKDYQKFLETELDGIKTRWFNVYRPLNWKPCAGGYSNSLSFIKHIFGTGQVVNTTGEKINEWELGLDYVKLLWEKPQQMLPMLFLVSEERHTGKTTFWDWMRIIFQQNAIFLEQEQLTGQFTSLFANVLLAILDESLIEKRTVVEKLKAMATAKTSRLEAKGKDAQEVENYRKIGGCSNNIDDFARIDPEEVRFWIRQIPVPKEKNLRLLDDLVEEIPHFLHFLENRDFVSIESDRAWFHPQIIETAALKNIKNESKWKLQKDMEEILKELISQVEEPILKLSLSDFKNLLDNKGLSITDIKNVLKRKMKKQPKATSGAYIYYSFSQGGNVVVQQNKKGRYYTFYASDLFSIPDFLSFLDSTSCIALDKVKPFWVNITLDDILAWPVIRKALGDGTIDALDPQKAFMEANTFQEFWKYIEKVQVLP